MSRPTLTWAMAAAWAVGLASPLARADDASPPPPRQGGARGGSGDVVVASSTSEVGDSGQSLAHPLPSREGDADPPNLVRELMRRRGGDGAAAAQLLQMTREFDPAVAAELFEVLADAHLAAGKINLAADARLLLLQTHPATPGARDAALWLTRLYASSEAAHRYRKPGVRSDAKADRGLATYGYSLASEFEEAAKLAHIAANSNDPPSLGSPVKDPELRFARAVAARRAGMAKPAAALLTPLKHLQPGDVWGDAARVEAWLAEGGDVRRAPKPLVRCVPAAAPPRLDGVLDDACWQGDAYVVIGLPTPDVMPTVRLAHDAKFLYIACEFPWAGVMAEADYSRDDLPRPRDGDLSQRDRVTLMLDADRDYATAWELTVDSRGWTGERCWGDAAWNPEWFVAAGGSPDGPTTLDPVWIAEAAIPWRELAAAAPGRGAVWALSVARTIPNAAAGNAVRRQHWPSPAEPATAPVGPEAFGVLVFE